MVKFRNKNTETVPSRHEEDSHQYTNSFPLSKSRILIAFPHLDKDEDFPALLKHMISNFSNDVRAEDSDILLRLYKNAVTANGWNYEAEEELFWSSDDAALLSLSHLDPRNERFLIYGLNEELWRIEYKDPIFGSRQFVGQVIEINKEEKYLILDSNGLKRRLNMSRILGAADYSKKWKAYQGTMKYALFTFADISANERKVSWRILPNDRSETLLEALDITEIPEIEGLSKDSPEEKLSIEVTHKSPLPSWEKALGEKVSVRVLKEDGFKDYYLVVDHLSWDSKTNIAEVGSKGLTLRSAPENLIMSLL